MDFLKKVLEDSIGDSDLLKELEREIKANRSSLSTQKAAPVYQHPRAGRQEFEPATCPTAKPAPSEKKSKGKKKGNKNKKPVAYENEFQVAECVSKERSEQKAAQAAPLVAVKPKALLLPNLRNRLGEAFLLTEILGRPMCERD